MKNTYTIIALLFFILFPTSAQNIPTDTIPFYMAPDSRIYTWCKVNNSDSLSFLIDTGASDMVINSRLRNQLDMQFDSFVENQGTTGTNKTEASSNNTLIWGSKKMDQLRFIELPYPMPELDGVLGLSVLSQFVIEINYDKKCIYLYDKDKFIPDADKSIPIQFKHNVPFINIKIQSHNKEVTALTEIDTGSDRILDLAHHFVEQHQLSSDLGAPFAISTITSSDGNAMQINNVFLPCLQIGSFNLYKIPGGYANGSNQVGILSSKEVDGMLGNTFLKRFNITLDLSRNQLYLEVNNQMYSPFYDFLIAK